MKVIGKAINGFLMQASDTEMEMIRGGTAANRISIGDEIAVSEVFHRLRSISARSEVIGKVASELRALADSLSAQAPILKEALDAPLGEGELAALVTP